MNIFEITNNLYTNPKADWIRDIDESEIEPFVLQTFLVMNDAVRVQTRWLDKYVFTLPPKMYLSLAWSVLPKTPKAPFVKYIKKVEEEEELEFILKEIRKQYKLSDNDYNTNKSRLIVSIKNNMQEYFKYYGVAKATWKKYYLDYDLIKVDEKKKPQPIKGLGAWGL